MTYESQNCIYCHNEFSNKYTLQRHLKNNYCTAFKEMSQYQVFKRTTEYTKEVFADTADTTDSLSKQQNVPIQKIDKKYFIRKLKGRTEKLINTYTLAQASNDIYQYLYTSVKDIIANKSDVCFVRWQRLYPPTFVVFTTEDSSPIVTSRSGATKYLLSTITDVINRTLNYTYAQLCRNPNFDRDLYELEPISNRIDDKAIKEAINHVLTHCVLRDPVFKFGF
jgi:hypothetical protein